MVRQAAILGGGMLFGRRTETLPVLGEMLGSHLLRHLRRQGIERFLLAGCSEMIAGAVKEEAMIETCEEAQLPEVLGGWHDDLLICYADVLTDTDLRGMDVIGNAGTALLRWGIPQCGDMLVLRDGYQRISGTRKAEADDMKPCLTFAGIMSVKAEAIAQQGMEALQLTGMRGRLMSGSCNHVKTAADYAHVQQNMLNGTLHLPVSGRKQGMAIVGDHARIGRGVRVAGRCYIGSGAVIGKNTVLGEGAVIGNGVRIGSGCHVDMSCIDEGCNIPSGRRISHLLVMRRPGNRRLRQILPYEPPQNT